MTRELQCFMHAVVSTNTLGLANPDALRIESNPIGGTNFMTRLLQEAFRKASELCEAEQDALAAAILADLEGERRWSQAFANSQDLLSRLAAEARQEYRAGHTLPLDPDHM